MSDTKPAPRGYIVIDEQKWSAQCNFMSDRDLDDLAENSLAKLGLKREKDWLEENGQEGFDF